jgi:hypothetical protein
MVHIQALMVPRSSLADYHRTRGIRGSVFLSRALVRGASDAILLQSEGCAPKLCQHRPHPGGARPHFLGLQTRHWFRGRRWTPAIPRRGMRRWGLTAMAFNELHHLCNPPVWFLQKRLRRSLRRSRTGFASCCTTGEFWSSQILLDAPLHPLALHARTPDKLTNTLIAS